MARGGGHPARLRTRRREIRADLARDRRAARAARAHASSLATHLPQLRHVPLSSCTSLGELSPFARRAATPAFGSTAGSRRFFSSTGRPDPADATHGFRERRLRGAIHLPQPREADTRNDWHVAISTVPANVRDLAAYPCRWVLSLPACRALHRRGGARGARASRTAKPGACATRLTTRIEIASPSPRARDWSASVRMHPSAAALHARSTTRPSRSTTSSSSPR